MRYGLLKKKNKRTDKYISGTEKSTEIDSHVYHHFHKGAKQFNERRFFSSNGADIASNP